MKRLLFLSVLTLSLAANAVVAAQAVRARTRTMPLTEVVDLGAEERAHVMDLRQHLVAARRENQARTRELRVELARLLATDMPDRARIDEVLNRISASQAELQQRVVEHVVAVRAVLTPAQRPSFDALMEKQLSAGVPMREHAAEERR